MQRKTILNQVTDYKSFLFDRVWRVEEEGEITLNVAIRARANGLVIGSGCGQAGKFLDPWCTRAMRSKIEPIKKAARTLRDKRELIRNWFRAEGQISAGIVEGFTNKRKLITRKSYGFRTRQAFETALYHNPGALPEPKLTHEFV